jgi:hypothetical protein
MSRFSKRIRALCRAARFVGRTMFATMVVLPALAEPRYITNLSRAGFLTSPTVNPPIVTLTAGERFLGLVPASQQELCDIELQYYASAVTGVKTVRIVNVAGQNLVTCGD